MTTKKELYEKAKQMGIKNRSKMTKQQLEEALIIHYANEWYNDLLTTDDVSLNLLSATDDVSFNLLSVDIPNDNQ